MTAKKGSLWKTSWNRGRGTPVPDPIGSMAFFQDFELNALNAARYETLLDFTLGGALPFWFAAVGIRQGIQQVHAPPVFENVQPRSNVDPFTGEGFVTAAGTVGLLVNFLLSLEVAGDDFVSAVFVIVKTSGTGFSVRSILADQVSDYATDPAAFPAPTDPISIRPRTLPGALHGFAAGAGEPSAAQVHQWFIDLKTNLAIQAIPGMTTHLYSAASVVGTPAILPNLGSDGAAQDMSLITVGAPTPANVLIPVRFPY